MKIIDNSTHGAIMAQLAVDVAFEIGAPLDNYLATLVDGTDVTATVLDECGPGGGWPIVQFDGPRDHLVHIAAVHAGPHGDPEFVISTIH